MGLVLPDGNDLLQNTSGTIWMTLFRQNQVVIPVHLQVRVQSLVSNKNLTESVSIAIEGLCHSLERSPLSVLYKQWFRMDLVSKQMPYRCDCRFLCKKRVIIKTNDYNSKHIQYTTTHNTAESKTKNVRNTY